jgi:hypothetical protein
VERPAAGGPESAACIVFATAHGGDAKLVVIVNWFTEVRRKLHQTGR